ncbi:MFS transporter [Rhodococcus pseudokoreensis]|uniref:MFS transporter n=2 Tax=Nocardiaceae TaxID=85025 RepID=A0A974ZZA1_9NOCA|nr:MULTISPECIES: MFS transporter [Rhodococcus]MBV6756785.1 MFS transporter [Rhodococcus opacus]QSE95815.1 MFS transporter [Rhodococcus pseudokoreensis]
MVTHAPDGGSARTRQQDVADERWTPRLIFSLASIVLLLEMLAVSYMMISIALPQIVTHYRTTQGAWLLTSFLLVGAVTCPLIGKLADTHGKRKLLLTAVGLSAVGSLISAIAPTYAVLIAGRSLTGLLVPCLFLSYSLIRDVFPARTVALAVSIATSGMGLIAIPAPFFTGWLIDNFGFRSIFWFFLAGLVVLSVLIRVTTDESTVRLRSRIDLIGAALLGAGLAGILVGVSFGPSWGWTSGSTVGFIAGGVALLVAWIVSALLLPDPLIDVRFFGKRPVFLTALGAGFCYGTSSVFTIMLPMMCMTPAILGLGYGFGISAEGFAIFQAPLGGAVVIGGLIVGTLVPRNVRPRILMVVGMLVMAAACLLTATIHDDKALLIGFAALLGLGMGMGYASIPNLLIAAVPPQLQATTASMVAVFQSILPAILPVIAFTVLNSHIATVVQGAVFYTDTGITIAFVIGAISALLGAVVAVALPRRISQLSAPRAESTSATDVVLAH